MSQHVSPTYYELWFILKKTNICARNIKTNVHVCGKCRLQRTRAWRVPRENKHYFSLTMRHNTTSAQEIQHVPRHDSKTPEKTPTCFVFQTLTNHAFSLPKVWKHLRKNEFEFLMCSKCLFESMYGKLDVSIFVSCFGTEVWKTFNCRCFLVILNKDLEGLKICGFSDIVYPRCLSAWVCVCVCDWLTACVGWPQTKRIHSNIN